MLCLVATQVSCSPVLCTSCCGDAVLGSGSGELFTHSIYQLLGRCCAWQQLRWVVHPFCIPDVGEMLCLEAIQVSCSSMLYTRCGGDAVLGSSWGELFTHSVYQMLGRCCAWQQLRWVVHPFCIPDVGEMLCLEAIQVSCSPMLYTRCWGDAVLGSSLGELFTHSIYQMLGRCCAW